MELVGPAWRVHTGIAFKYFWASGYMLVALFAFYIRDWSRLQLALALPQILLLGWIL